MPAEISRGFDFAWQYLNASTPGMVVAPTGELVPAFPFGGASKNDNDRVRIPMFRVPSRALFRLDFVGFSGADATGGPFVWKLLADGHDVAISTFSTDSSISFVPSTYLPSTTSIGTLDVPILSAPVEVSDLLELSCDAPLGSFDVDARVLRARWRFKGVLRKNDSFDAFKLENERPAPGERIFGLLRGLL